MERGEVMEKRVVELLEQILKKLGRIESTLEVIYKIKKSDNTNDQHLPTHKKNKIQKDKKTISSHPKYDWENQMPYEEVMKKFSKMDSSKES